LVYVSPLALQSQSWLVYHTSALIGLAYFFLFINSVAAIGASLIMFIDAIKTRPKEGKIPIFAAYAMSIAGYEGLIRRWNAYPVQFQPLMDTMSYGAMIMGISFAFMAIPIVFSMFGIGTSIFWTATTGVTTSTPGITISTKPSADGKPEVSKETENKQGVKSKGNLFYLNNNIGKLK